MTVLIQIQKNGGFVSLTNGTTFDYRRIRGNKSNVPKQKMSFKVVRKVSAVLISVKKISTRLSFQTKITKWLSLWNAVPRFIQLIIISNSQLQFHILTEMRIIQYSSKTRTIPTFWKDHPCQTFYIVKQFDAHPKNSTITHKFIFKTLKTHSECP